MMDNPVSGHGTDAAHGVEELARVDDVEAGSADGMGFFSDAVVAVAITPLALDLPVPATSSPDAFSASLSNDGSR
jgi:uncharacterized membrane protein